jgi:hypothetical protein
MTLAEEISRKYGLTSFKPKGSCLALLAINEALEAAAGIAEQEHGIATASRIRSLKWVDGAISPASLHDVMPITKAA